MSLHGYSVYIGATNGSSRNLDRQIGGWIVVQVNAIRHTSADGRWPGGAGGEEGLQGQTGINCYFSNISPSLQATPNVLNKAATGGKAPAGGATAAPGVTDADMKKFTVRSRVSCQ